MPGIIVEGTEQTGKTTLANKLAARLGIEYSHMHRGSGFVNGVFDYYHGYFRDAVRTNEAGEALAYVLDRNYASELAYGRLFGRNNIDDRLRRKIEKRFNELGYVFVLCHWDGAWIDRDETVTSEQSKLVAAHYDEVFEGVTLPKLRVCPRRDPDALDRIVGLYERVRNG